METSRVKMISVGQLLGLAKRGYAANFRLLLILGILPYALTLLPALVKFLQNIGASFLADGLVKNLYYLMTYLLFFGSYIMAFVGSNLSAIALMLMVKAGRQNISIRQAWAQAWPYFGRYIWVSILTGILLLLWSLLFLIPAIIMAGYYSMAVWLVLEGQYRGYGAIKQSKALVKGYWWSIFKRQLLMLFFVVVISALIAYVCASIYGPAFLESTAAGSGKIVFSSLVNIFVAVGMPFYMIYFYQIYQNLKEIKNQPKI